MSHIKLLFVGLSFFLAMCPTIAQAEFVLYADTFDRANSDNLAASGDGITNNTGSIGLPYVEPFGAVRSQIVGNQLSLATGNGTSNVYGSHNFTNSEITTNGNFKVSVDVTGFNRTGGGFGGAFAIGMTEAEASSAGDARSGNSKFQDTFDTIAGSTSISDFWLGIRGDNLLTWGGLGETKFGTFDAGKKTGEISAEFMLTDFNMGSTVNFEVFFDDVSRGSGSFTWSDANSNFIGLDARDNIGVTFDNFAVTTTAVPEPSSLVLTSMVGVGWLVRRRRKQVVA